MWMALIVILKPSGELVKRGRGVWDRIDTEVVALAGPHEGVADAVLSGLATGVKQGARLAA